MRNMSCGARSCGGRQLLCCAQNTICSGGCRRLRYCNAKCQKLDWSAHKGVCRVLTEVNKLEADFGRARASMEGDDAVRWDGELALPLMRMCIKKLEETLKKPWDEIGIEGQFITFTKRCRMCFRTPAVVAGAQYRDKGVDDPVFHATDKFLHCKDCKLAACCSESCWEQYAPVHASNGSCAALTYFREHTAWFFRCRVTDALEETGAWISDDRLRGKFTGLPELDLPTELRSVRPTLRLQPLGNMPGTIITAASAIAPPGLQKKGGAAKDEVAGWAWEAYLKYRGAPSRFQAPLGLWLHTTMALGKPLAIVQALQRIKGLEWCSTVKSLTIHFIEAKLGYELHHVSFYEEIMHLFPSLRTLKLGFAGWFNFTPPWPGQYADGKPLEYKELEACPACQKLRATRSVAVRAGHYVEGMVDPSGSPVETPDLVVSLNNSWREYGLAPDLRPSLAYILKQGWPLLVTTFGQDEIYGALNELRYSASSLSGPTPASGPGSNAGNSAGNSESTMTVQQLVPPMPNPYAGLCLRQDMEERSREVAAAKSGMRAEEIGSRLSGSMADVMLGAGLAGVEEEHVPPPSLAMDQFYADNKWMMVVQGRTSP